jgi:hypothetical protein
MLGQRNVLVFAPIVGGSEIPSGCQNVAIGITMPWRPLGRQNIKRKIKMLHG